MTVKQLKCVLSTYVLSQNQFHKAYWFEFASYLNNTCTNKCNHNGNQVYSKLKLQKLWDTVINITPPHDGLNNTSKVVISKNDVRCLFSNICSSNALQDNKNIKFHHPI